MSALDLRVQPQGEGLGPFRENRKSSCYIELQAWCNCIIAEQML